VVCKQSGNVCVVVTLIIEELIEVQELKGCNNIFFDRCQIIQVPCDETYGVLKLRQNKIETYT
jgi:hypothetical protein